MYTTVLAHTPRVPFAYSRVRTGTHTASRPHATKQQALPLVLVLVLVLVLPPMAN
jgi:hypothetical protein